jgi:hypothetical protein
MNRKEIRLVLKRIDRLTSYFTVICVPGQSLNIDSACGVIRDGEYSLVEILQTARDLCKR